MSHFLKEKNKDLSTLIFDLATQYNESKQGFSSTAAVFTPRQSTKLLKKNTILTFLFNIVCTSIKKESDSGELQGQYLADIYKLISNSYLNGNIDQTHIKNIINKISEENPDFENPTTFIKYELIHDLIQLSQFTLDLKSFNDFKSKQNESTIPEDSTKTTRESCETLCQNINAKDIRVDSRVLKLNLKINTEVEGKQLHDALIRLNKAVADHKLFHQNGEFIVLKENSTQCHRILA